MISSVLAHAHRLHFEVNAEPLLDTLNVDVDPVGELRVKHDVGAEKSRQLGLIRFGRACTLIVVCRRRLLGRLVVISREYTIGHARGELLRRPIHALHG